MSQTKFENKRWEKGGQILTYRHKTAINMIKEGKIIDLGCGDGLFLKMLKEKGIKDLVGVDLSSIAVEKCQQAGYEAIQSDLSQEKLPFRDKEFENAVMLDILEHLFNPEDLFNEAKRISEKIIISVPNFNSLPARLQMLCGRVPENNRPKKGHVFWFNYKILKQIIDGSGLEIEARECNYFWENKFLIGKIIKFLGKYLPSVFALSFIVKLKQK